MLAGFKTRIMTKFVIIKRKNGQYQFLLKVGNKVILSSKKYQKKKVCLKHLEFAKSNASNHRRYKGWGLTVDRLRFRLEFTNGRPFAVTNIYNSRAAMNKALDSIMNNASEAIVEDLTT